MLIFRLFLLSLLLLLPAPRLENDPCPRGTPIATPDPDTPAGTNPCPTTPTPAGSTVNLPFAGAGNSNLQSGSDTAAQNTRNNYLIAAGVTTIVLGAAGFLLLRRPKNKAG